MEKQYCVFSMIDAHEGFGIVAAEFLKKEGKDGGKSWKSKPLFTGTFDACMKEKRKQINIAKSTVKA